MLLSCNFQAYDFVQQKIFLVPNSAIPSKLKLTIFQNVESYPQISLTFFAWLWRVYTLCFVEKCSKSIWYECPFRKKNCNTVFSTYFPKWHFKLKPFKKIHKNIQAFCIIHTCTQKLICWSLYFKVSVKGRKQKLIYILLQTCLVCVTLTKIKSGFIKTMFFDYSHGQKKINLHSWVQFITF